MKRATVWQRNAHGVEFTRGNLGEWKVAAAIVAPPSWQGGDIFDAVELDARRLAPLRSAFGERVVTIPHPLKGKVILCDWSESQAQRYLDGDLAAVLLGMIDSCYNATAAGWKAVLDGRMTAEAYRKSRDNREATLAENLMAVRLAFCNLLTIDAKDLDKSDSAE